MSSLVSQSVLSGMTILIVDDEPDNVNVIVKLLTMLGAEAFSAEDGQQGLDLARNRKPDVIFADLSMPVMTGWEMLHHMKEDPILKDIPVVALTAHAMAGDRQRVLAAGFAHYFAKPIDVPQFIPQLVEMLKEIPQTAPHLAL